MWYISEILYQQLVTSMNTTSSDQPEKIHDFILFYHI